MIDINVAETSKSMPNKPLRHYVKEVLKNYFLQLEDQPAVNLYEMVLAEVEMPLLQAVLEQVNGNQSKAADMLGLSRATLRKKLKQYNLE